MKRRDFLKIAGLAPLALAAPPGLLASALPARARDRVLVLIELGGGNDGLNTVVPFTQARYYHLRPQLALARDSVLPLSTDLGLNPGLSPLMDCWDDADLAVVLGVGYPTPNRSHFRSIDIWETASDSDRVLADGWIARVLSGHTQPDLVAEAIVLGDGDVGPMAGSGIRALVMEDPRSFARLAAELPPAVPASGNPALEHLAAVQSDVLAAGRALDTRLAAAPPLSAAFPTSPIGSQLETAALLLAAGVAVPVIKVTQTGYDTHANQRRRHDALLSQLAEAMAAFRTAVRDAGRWGDVLVMTYSEFGRRATENASGGTDHGTAAPHLIAGGSVRGGLYGAQPSLEDLVDGDLQHHVDFRSLYATIAQRWWHLDDAFLGDWSFPVLDVI